MMTIFFTDSATDSHSTDGKDGKKDPFSRITVSSIIIGFCMTSIYRYYYIVL